MEEREGGKGMITPTLIYRYSIELYVSTECSLAELFSGSWKDGGEFAAAGPAGCGSILS